MLLTQRNKKCTRCSQEIIAIKTFKSFFKRWSESKMHSPIASKSRKNSNLFIFFSQKCTAKLFFKHFFNFFLKLRILLWLKGINLLYAAVSHLNISLLKNNLKKLFTKGKFSFNSFFAALESCLFLFFYRNFTMHNRNLFDSLK